MRAVWRETEQLAFLKVMEGITYGFLDWARERIVEHSEGLLKPDDVFDEREQGLVQSIKLAVGKGLGLAVVLTLPSLRQQGDEPGETQYEASAEVWVFHNKALSAEVDSALLTEHLFLQFAGASYNKPDSYLRANVRADGLQHDVNGTKQTHYFTISYKEVI